MGLIIIPGQSGGEEAAQGEPRTLRANSLRNWAMAAHKLYDDQRYKGGRKPISQGDAAIYQAIKESVANETADPRMAVLMVMGLLASLHPEPSHGDALTNLLGDIAWSLEAHGLTVRQCRVCGCSNTFGCETGCWWVDWDLCSACEHTPEAADPGRSVIDSWGRITLVEPSM